VDRPRRLGRPEHRYSHSVADRPPPNSVSENWYTWHDDSRAAAENMAVDDALLRTAPDRACPLLRFYGWTRPSLTIGYFQRYAAVVRDGFEVVRRPTGGGVVNHVNDLTCTIAVPRGHWYLDVDRFESYRLVNQAIVDGLEFLDIPASLTAEDTTRTEDRETMQCFTAPTRYDVISGDCKVAGGAQRRTVDGLLYQGSISLDALPPVDRLALISAVEQGFEKIFDCCFLPCENPAQFQTIVDELTVSRYGNDAWNRRR
jgi:lipoate-protein ligase A